MLQTTSKMSRASRQIITELNKHSDTANVQGFLIPAHIYICDYMTIKYSQTAIINVIKSKLSKMTRKDFTHFTPLYWYKIVDNMLGRGNNGSCRNQDIKIYGEMSDYNAFNHITKMFLLNDYSIQDSIIINRIVNEYELSDIVSACKIATQNGVYSITYVDAVLKDIDAKKKAEEIRIRLLGNKIEQSTMNIVNETHKHTPMELAKSEYDYNKKREDILLELLVDKMFGGN